MFKSCLASICKLIDFFIKLREGFIFYYVLLYSSWKREIGFVEKGIACRCDVDCLFLVERERDTWALNLSQISVALSRDKID